MTFQSIRTHLLALAALALSGSIVLAQQTPPPTPPAPASPDASAPAAAPIERQPPSDPGMNPHMRPGMLRGKMGPGMGSRTMQRNGPANFRGEAMMHNRGRIDGGFDGPMGASSHIAPAGMWWKDPMVVQKLTLTPEQTRKMDGIFQQSRIQLIDLKANVEKQEVLLEPMLSANPPDTTKAMAQIDKVAQARADLEKAHARMLLGLRGALTPDQWTKLSSRGFGGPGSPDAQGGPNGPGAPGGGPGRGRAPRGGGPPPLTNNLVQPIE